MRSLLTCIGIVIGIAAVIVMMELGHGTAQAIRRTIASMGANQLLVEAGTTSSSGISSGGGTALTLSPMDSEAIVRQCDTVRWAAPTDSGRVSVATPTHCGDESPTTSRRLTPGVAGFETCHRRRGH